MSYQRIEGARSTRFPFQGLDGCVGCGLGAAAAPKGGARVAPVSAAALSAASTLERLIADLTERREFDDMAFSNAEYLAAFRKVQGLVERASRVAGSTTMTGRETAQLAWGSLMQAKRGVIGLRQLAYSPAPRARVLEQRLARVTGNLIRAVSGMVRSARPSGVSGLGILPFFGVAFFVLTLYQLRDLVSSTEDVNDVLNTLLSDPNLSPEERSRLWEIYLAEKRKGEEARARNPGPFDGVLGALGDALKWVVIAGAAGVGIYALWVFGPALVAGGRKARGKLKERAAA